MNANPKSRKVGLALASSILFSSWINGAGAGAADAAEDKTKNIIAAQLRRQGFVCEEPQSAEREAAGSDNTVWILKCKAATYRVKLNPPRAAVVEKLN